MGVDIAELKGRISMEIRVCVGSSCHLKGAPAVIEAFQEALKHRQKTDQVERLGACYCQEHCQDGVTVRINGKLHTKVTPDMVERLLAEGDEIRD